MKYYLAKSLVNTTIDYYILYVIEETSHRIRMNGFQAIVNYNIQDLLYKKDYINYNQLVIYHISDNLKECIEYLNMIRDSEKYNI